MTRKEVKFTRLIRSRGMAILFGIASFIMVFQAWIADAIPQLNNSMTIAFTSPTEWIGDSWLSMWVNMALIVVTGVIMIAINRCFNLLRTLSVYFAAFFLFATASTPIVAGQLSGSVLLAIVVLLAIWIMYTIYSVRASSRRVFLVFFLLGAMALIQYAVLLYIPVFLIGLGQMRIFHFKKLIAALLGVITPAWIALGLGFTHLPDLPVIEFTQPAMLISQPGGWPFIATVAFSLLLGFFTGMINLIKIIGFNSQARAYNGLLTIVSIATGIFAIINFTNMAFYVILLNACVAFQIGHFFRFTAMRRGYLFVTFFMIIYLVLYLWAMAESL